MSKYNMYVRDEEGEVSIEAVLNKLGGVGGARRLLRGELEIVVKAVKAFPIWLTCRVGGMSTAELLKQLKQNDCFLYDWAKDIMGKSAFTASARPSDVSFVKVQVKDLGFTEMPTTTELFDEGRLACYGLALCEAEDGPTLRLADKNQPNGTWYRVAMKPITDSDGCPDVFRVRRDADGERWLDACCANPENRWSLDSTVVFRSRT